MKLKRIFCTVLGLLLISSSLAACGSSNTSTAPGAENSSEAVSSQSQSTADGGGKVKAYLIMAQRDEWLSALESAASKAASEIENVELSVADAQSDTSKLLQLVETARSGGYDAVIVNMVDPNSAPDVVASAGDMKVVFVNRFPADPSVFSENVVYVGSDESSSGQFQGEYLAEYFKNKGQTEIRYVLLNGILGQVSTTLRTESVLKSLADSGITATEATSPLACDFDRATAMDKFSPLIGTLDFDCIISNNDAMALGVIEALQSKDVDPASIPVVGIDASTDGRQAVKEGKLAMSVFQDPKGQGTGSVHAAVNLVQGQPLDTNTAYKVDETGHILWVPFEPVTQENVNEYDNR